MEQFTRVALSNRRRAIRRILCLKTILFLMPYSGLLVFCGLHWYDGGDMAYLAVFLGIITGWGIYALLRTTARLIEASWLSDWYEVNTICIRQNSPSGDIVEGRWDDLAYVKDGGFFRISLCHFGRRILFGIEPTLLVFHDGARIKIPKIGVYQGCEEWILRLHTELAEAGPPNNFLGQELAAEEGRTQKLVRRLWDNSEKREHVMLQLLPVGLMVVATFLYFGLETISGTQYGIYISSAVVMSFVLAVLVRVAARSANQKARKERFFVDWQEKDRHL